MRRCAVGRLFGAPTVLRRVVHFRKISLRANGQRAMPWRELLDWAYRTLISATASQLDGPRRRRKVPLATS